MEEEKIDEGQQKDCQFKRTIGMPSLCLYLPKHQLKYDYFSKTPPHISVLPKLQPESEFLAINSIFYSDYNHHLTNDVPIVPLESYHINNYSYKTVFSQPCCSQISSDLTLSPREVSRAMTKSNLFTTEELSLQIPCFLSSSQQLLFHSPKCANNTNVENLCSECFCTSSKSKNKIASNDNLIPQKNYRKVLLASFLNMPAIHFQKNQFYNEDSNKKKNINACYEKFKKKILLQKLSLASNKLKYLLYNNLYWIYISFWFILSMVMTLYVKSMFSVRNLPYPMLVTSTHMVFTWGGMTILKKLGVYEQQALCRKRFIRMVLFSFVFSLNIWLSNASLMAVSVRLHQLLRTTTPLLTMAVSYIFFGEKYSVKMLPSVCLTIIGVVITLKNEVEFELFGILFVFAGALASVFKAILTQKTQLGNLGICSFDLLRRMSSLAALQLFCISFLSGEFHSIFLNKNLSLFHLVDLSVVGLVAFLINLFSFYIAAYFNPLTLNITGIVRQVLTCFLDAAYSQQLNFIIPLGFTCTMIGAIWYAYDMKKMNKKKNKQTKQNENQQQQFINFETKTLFRSIYGLLLPSRCYLVYSFTECICLT